MSQIGELAPSAEIEHRTDEWVAILDGGGQYNKVIDRRVRGLMVRSVLLPIDTPYEQLEGCSAIIFTGGPESVYAPDAPKPDSRVWESGKPILGICYGMHLINQAYGGTVERKDSGEYGPATVSVDSGTPFFTNLDNTQNVLMSHGDSLGSIAPSFRTVAMSGDIVAGIADEQRRIYGVQFHPEVDLTENGTSMLSNFLFNIAELEPLYTLEDRIETAMTHIKEFVGERQVLIFASGGVDSTVCSILIGKALPKEQVKIVHIDTGFMRRNESMLVREALGASGINVDVVDATDRFMGATTTHNSEETLPLHQTTDPEIKRRIIGDSFMKVLDSVVSELKLDPDNTVLAQGTLRPDLIESASHIASSKAAAIKTHHNDTQLVRDLRAANRVIEPLAELHKDEVRKIGAMLGLPGELVWRQPFPGPGLAIRLLCAKEPYITDQYDAIATLLKRNFEDDETSTHLLPVRTVGVQGDGRSYSYLAALSGTAGWQRLMEKARTIPQQIREINRVVYIFGEKLEPSLLSGDDDQSLLGITPTLPTPDAIEQLREADWHVNEVLRHYGLHESLSQVPVVSFPVHFGKPGYRSIGIRTFMTNDFMTGVPAIPGIHIPEEAVFEMVERILTVPKIARVVYDLTSKPPGTTEWE